jgi:hypothetical protein
MPDEKKLQPPEHQKQQPGREHKTEPRPRAEDEWSHGENFLAIATSGAPLAIHPSFREDTHCSVCELMPPLASPSGVQHRFRVFLPPSYHEKHTSINFPPSDNQPISGTEAGLDWSEFSRSQSSGFQSRLRK